MPEGSCGEELKRHVPQHSAPIRLKEILLPERVFTLDVIRKKPALTTLIECLSQSPDVTDPAELKSEIFRREELMSTGIALGIGVPHVRLQSVKNIVAAVGINKRDILDYETLDGSPVRIIIMILARPDQHEQYLMALAAITAKLTHAATREAILNASDTATIHNILTGE